MRTGMMRNGQQMEGHHRNDRDGWTGEGAGWRRDMRDEMRRPQNTTVTDVIFIIHAR